MSCPFLEGESRKFCTAYEELMVMSLEELKKFCEADEFHLCPVYKTRRSYKPMNEGYQPCVGAVGYGAVSIGGSSTPKAPLGGTGQSTGIGGSTDQGSGRGKSNK
jgi:hypothetical protein